MHLSVSLQESRFAAPLPPRPQLPDLPAGSPGQRGSRKITRNERDYRAVSGALIRDGMVLRVCT